MRASLASGVAVSRPNGRSRRLQLDELGLAQHGQAGEVGAAGDRVRLDIGQPVGEIGRVVERVADQPRQGVEDRRFAVGRVAHLLAIVIGPTRLRHRPLDPRVSIASLLSP